MLRLRPGAAVLDVGCGAGEVCVELAARVGPSGRVAGIDPSDAMLDAARRAAKASPLAIELHVAIVYDLPFPDGTFDAVRAERVFQHLENPEAGLREGMRVWAGQGAAAFLCCAVWAAGVCAQGVLEIPAPNSTQAGIGLVSGWHCSASRIEIVIDGGAPLLAGSHTDRKDTTSVCGRSDTGFSLLWNWNLLPTDCFGCRYHHVVALADGVPFASTEFQVENFRTEFLTGKSGLYSLPNFPDIGDTSWVQWDETRQNFSLYLFARRPGESAPGANVSGTYFGALESGAHNPACGPWPPDRILPLKYGSFIVQVANGRMSLTARYADGTTCALAPTALAPPDNSLDLDGYVRAVFDPAAVAQCPEFPGGLSVRVDGLRLTADSQDNCTTAAVRGAR